MFQLYKINGEKKKSNISSKSSEKSNDHLHSFACWKRPVTSCSCMLELKKDMCCRSVVSSRAVVMAAAESGPKNKPTAWLNKK